MNISLFLKKQKEAPEELGVDFSLSPQENFCRLYAIKQSRLEIYHRYKIEAFSYAGVIAATIPAAAFIPNPKSSFPMYTVLNLAGVIFLTIRLLVILNRNAKFSRLAEEASVNLLPVVKTVDLQTAKEIFEKSDTLRQYLDKVISGKRLLCLGELSAAANWLSNKRAAKVRADACLALYGTPTYPD